MFQMWCKLVDDRGRLLKDTVIKDSSADTRTHKVFHAIEAACKEMDVSQPIWLDNSKKDFQQFSHVRFYQDNFIEPISFDYLEIRMLEED